MTLRDALVTLEQRMRNASDHGYSFEDAEARVALSNELAEILAAHPAVEGDAVPKLPAYGIDTANHANVRVRGYTADQMHAYARAALDAAWPGMVADSARLDYIERAFSGMTNRERYLPVQMIWGKGCNGRTLREACDKYMKRDAAMESSRG